MSWVRASAECPSESVISVFATTRLRSRGRRVSLAAIAGGLDNWSFPKIQENFDVNKFQPYRQIREELATHYEKELRNVSALLEEGVEGVVSANTRISVGKTESLVANGDASKVFREEINEAVRLILERYHRSLRKEVETLGLRYSEEGWKDSGSKLSTAMGHSASLRSGNGAEPH